MSPGTLAISKRLPGRRRSLGGDPRQAAKPIAVVWLSCADGQHPHAWSYLTPRLPDRAQPLDPPGWPGCGGRVVPGGGFSAALYTYKVGIVHPNLCMFTIVKFIHSLLADLSAQRVHGLSTALLGDFCAFSY